VVIVQPKWLSKSRDRGTSAEWSEHATTATTSACSECSQLKEDLGDVNRRLNAQELEMDTLRQLVEGLRSSTLTAPPVPLPTAAVQTSTPVDSLVLVPCAPSPSPIPASAGITSGTDAHIPDQQVPGHSPSHVPALLEGEGSSVVDPRPVNVPTDLLITLWCPTGDDPHSPRSANSSADEDYAPPPRPLQTDTFSDATMVVDTPTLPPPTIVVTSSDGSSALGPPGVLDASVGDGVDTQMDTAA